MKVTNENDGTTVHFHGTNGVHPLDYEEEFNRSFYGGGQNRNDDGVGDSLESTCKRCGGNSKYYGCRPDKCKRTTVPSTYHIYDPNAPVCLDMVKYQKWCKCLAYIKVPNCFKGCETESVEPVIKSIIRKISIVPYGMDCIAQGYWVFNEYPQIEAFKSKCGKHLIIYVIAPASANQITDYINLMKSQYEKSKKCQVSFCLDDLYSSNEYKTMKTGCYENACTILFEIAKELRLQIRTQRRLMKNAYCIKNNNLGDQIYGSKLQPHCIMAVPCNYQHFNTYCRMNERMVSKGHDVIGGDINHTIQNYNCDSESKMDSSKSSGASFMDEFNRIHNHCGDGDRISSESNANVSGNHHINQMSQFAISALFDGFNQVDFLKSNVQHDHAKQMMGMLHDGLITTEEFKKTVDVDQDTLESEMKRKKDDTNNVIGELNEFLKKLNMMSQGDGNKQYNDLAEKIKSNIMNDVQQLSGKHIEAFLSNAKKELKNQELMFKFNHYSEKNNDSSSLFEHLMENFSKTLNSVMSSNDAQRMIDRNSEALKKNIMENPASIGCYTAPPNEDLFSCFKTHGRDAAFGKGNRTSKNVITYNNNCVLLRESPDNKSECDLWNEKASTLEGAQELTELSKKEKFTYKDPDMHHYKKGEDSASDNVVVFYRPDSKKEYLCLLKIDPEGRDDWKRKWKKGRPPVVSLDMSKPEMNKLKNMGIVYEKYEPVTKLSDNFMKSYNLCKLVDSVSDYHRKTRRVSGEDDTKRRSNDDSTEKKCSFDFKNKNVGGDRLKFLLKQNK